MLVVDIG